MSKTVALVLFKYTIWMVQFRLLKRCNTLYAFKVQLFRSQFSKSNAQRQAIDLFHAFQRLHSFALKFYEIETLLPRYDVGRLRIILRKLQWN